MERVGWCSNSRIWIDFSLITPKTCPYNDDQNPYALVDCEQCGYYELREPTAYLKRKLKIFQKWEARSD